jgi:CheY-like chemotaxis protein
VDDNARFLAAASALLEREGLNVVGVAMSTADAMRHVQELEPEVVLVDIDLGGESGFELARQLADEGRASRSDIILISAHPEDDFADLIEESPALGFISKSDLSAGAIGKLLAA